MSGMIGKLARQSEETWSALHKRLSSMDFNLEKVLTKPNLSNFVCDKASALSCCPGYIIAGILTTVAFIVGTTCNLVTPSGYECKPNLFHLICGPPSTGKSQAVKETSIDPINKLTEEEEGSSSPLIQKTTSSGLTKVLSTCHRGYIVCTEIFDTLYKLLRGDGDISTGDTALLCELFSGEQISLSYGSQSKRDIPEKLPFGLFGSIQVCPLSKIMALLDQGHGLLDRFLILVPLCLRPSPATSEAARNRIKDLPVSSFSDIFGKISELLTVSVNFCFSDDAASAIKDMEEQYIVEINEAITNGQSPPKSKKVDLVMRVSLALHVFSFVLDSLLQGTEVDAIPIEISLEHLEAALYYVTFCEMQKSVLSQFILDLLSSAFDPPKYSPTASDMKQAVALFPGKLVTLRAFKSSGTRIMRSTTEAEFTKITGELISFGKTTSLRVPRARQQTLVFIKKNPADIGDDEWTSQINKDAYTTQFDKPINGKISDNIKQRLVELNQVSENYFE